MLERESTLELDFLSSNPRPPLPDCADLGEFFSFLEPQFLAVTWKSQYPCFIEPND